MFTDQGGAPDLWHLKRAVASELFFGVFASEATRKRNLQLGLKPRSQRTKATKTKGWLVVRQILEIQQAEFEPEPCDLSQCLYLSEFTQSESVVRIKWERGRQWLTHSLRSGSCYHDLCALLLGASSCYLNMEPATFLVKMSLRFPYGKKLPTDLTSFLGYL